MVFCATIRGPSQFSFGMMYFPRGDKCFDVINQHGIQSIDDLDNRAVIYHVHYWLGIIKPEPCCVLQQAAQLKLCRQPFSAKKTGDQWFVLVTLVSDRNHDQFSLEPTLHASDLPR